MGECEGYWNGGWGGEDVGWEGVYCVGGVGEGVGDEWTYG